jgi:hypothetical protein
METVFAASSSGVKSNMLGPAAPRGRSRGLAGGGAHVADGAVDIHDRDDIERILEEETEDIVTLLELRRIASYSI